MDNANGDATRRDGTRRGSSLWFRERAAWRAEWATARQEFRERARLQLREEYRRARSGCPSRNIFLRAPSEWLVGVLYLVHVTYARGDVRWALDLVNSSIRTRIREVLGGAPSRYLEVLDDVGGAPHNLPFREVWYIPERWHAAMIGLELRLGHDLWFGNSDALTTLSLLTAERQMAKRWDRLVDRMVFLRSSLDPWGPSPTLKCVALQTYRYTHRRRRMARRVLRYTYHLCGITGITSDELRGQIYELRERSLRFDQAA